VRTKVCGLGKTSIPDRDGALDVVESAQKSSDLAKG
jgi:hypothetical protein